MIFNHFQIEEYIYIIILDIQVLQIWIWEKTSCV